MSQILEQAEALRQQAICLLVAERQEIERKLVTLGYDGTEPPTTRKSKNCSECGSADHNARFHRKVAAEGTGGTLISITSA